MGLVFGLRAERLLLDVLDAIKSEDPEGQSGLDPEIEPSNEEEVADANPL